MNLNGKYALITGGSRGIGRAIALKLAQAGAHVAINYVRRKEPAQEIARQVEAYGQKALVIRANVAEPDHIDSMFDKIATEFGQLDILVSNAASGVLKPARELTLKHWQHTMNINAAAFIPLIQHSVPLMKTGGKVVAVSSLGATRAIPNYTAVGASKAALESLVRHIAIEMAPLNINVNAVSAGAVDTDALRHFPNRDELLEGSRQKTPAGRLVTPDDVADAVLFLCTDYSKMIVGQTIVVDGGFSIQAY